MKFLAARSPVITDDQKPVPYWHNELGMEYQFIKEAKMCSQIGIFPLIEIPTSDEKHVLARSGCVQIFMPLSSQKVWREETKNRTMYGGVDTDVTQGLITKINVFFEWILNLNLSRYLMSRVRVFNRITPSLDRLESLEIGIERSAALKKDWQVVSTLGYSIGYSNGMSWSWCVELLGTW